MGGGKRWTDKKSTGIIIISKRFRSDIFKLNDLFFELLLKNTFAYINEMDLTEISGTSIGDDIDCDTVHIVSHPCNCFLSLCSFTCLSPPPSTF